MSARPPVLDVRSVLQAAYAVRDTDPSLFGEWLRDTYGVASTWHDQPTDGTWEHHASSVGECLRRHILARSGAERAPWEVETLTTFEVGKHLHLLLQFGLAVHPDYTLLGHEIGGVAERNGVKLAALADAVYLDPGGELCIFDLKSERDYAQKYRIEEAKASGRSHTAKPEHVLQLKATAAVIHRLTEHRPMWGWIVYWSKDNGRIDAQPVPLGVAEVLEALATRENAWVDFSLYGSLPARLDTFPDKGLCKPRSKTDARGIWCPYREECSRRPA